MANDEGMKVPSFEESAKQLIDSDKTDFEEFSEVEEAVEEKREEMRGFVDDKNVLAHLVVKGEGLTKMQPVGGELEISELNGNMSDLVVKAYLLDYRQIEKEDGEDFVIANISDRTGDVVAFMFGDMIDEFLEYDPSFGDTFAFEGYTRENNGRLSLNVSEGVKKIDPLKESIAEGIKKNINALETLDEYQYFATEGIVTEIDTGTYEGCPECMKSLDEGTDVCPNCSFGINELKEYTIGSITIMTPDGRNDAEISISPRTNGIPDVAQKPARVFGQKRYRENDDGEQEVQLQMIAVEPLNTDKEGGESEDTEESEDEGEVEEFLTFVGDFGKAPVDVALNYCKENLDMDKKEAEEFIETLKEDDEIIEKDEKLKIAE